MNHNFAIKVIIMQANTLSFRADEQLFEQTRALANAIGLKSSDYMRDAVREKNERVTAQRIAMLSKELAAEHLSLNEAIEGSLKDGLE
jgi:predicted transcriptional regulator